MQTETHCWVEVNLSAIKQNYRSIRSVLGVPVIAVVKGNAYGHGMAEAGLALQEAGAEMLAVTYGQEALALRNAGVQAEILVMSPPRGQDAVMAVQAGAACTVMDLKGARELAGYASLASRETVVHLKIDSGMGRLGVLPEEAAEMAGEIVRMPELKLGGVFSHFAVGYDQEAAGEQTAIFQKAVRSIESSGITPGLRHIAASAGALAYPQALMDAARVGTLIFGQYPTRSLAKKFGKKLALQEAWKFQARVVAVRRLPAGSKIGYGWEFRPRRPVTIAVVSAGLADGLGMQPASLSRRGWKGVLTSLVRRPSAGLAMIHGQPAPIVGRIAMQLATVDVTALPEVNIGDVVTLPVRRLAVGSGIPRVFLP